MRFQVSHPNLVKQRGVPPPPPRRRRRCQTDSGRIRLGNATAAWSTATSRRPLQAVAAWPQGRPPTGTLVRFSPAPSGSSCTGRTGSGRKVTCPDKAAAPRPDWAQPSSSARSGGRVRAKADRNARLGVPVPLGAPEAPPVRWRRGAGQRFVDGTYVSRIGVHSWNLPLSASFYGA